MVLEKSKSITEISDEQRTCRKKKGPVLQSPLLTLVYIQKSHVFSLYSVLYLTLSMTQGLSPSTGGQELIVILGFLN